MASIYFVQTVTYPLSDWHLYILRTADDRLYTGISTDVERRFSEHSRGKGAKAIRHGHPLTLCYQVCLGSRSLALKAEYRIKQLLRSDKLALINATPDAKTLLKKLGLTADQA